jgi:hypothetical protein
MEKAVILLKNNIKNLNNGVKNSVNERIYPPRDVLKLEKGLS